MISNQDLKVRLSAAVMEAEAGNTVLIARHSTPVAQLTPVRVSNVHQGRNVGKEKLSAVLKRGTKGRCLAILSEDRCGR
jgi:antitoxin (DNA-binding transcriptional repressor) of toxin-antitoxin stability system